MKKITWIFAVLFFALMVAGCSFDSYSPYQTLTAPTATATPTAPDPSPIAKPTAPAPQDCTVSASALHLRTGAGVDYSVIEFLNNGQALTRIGEVRGQWVQVRTGDGLQGWINSLYCK